MPQYRSDIPPEVRANLDGDYKKLGGRGKGKLDVFFNERGEVVKIYLVLGPWTSGEIDTREFEQRDRSW